MAMCLSRPHSPMMPCHSAIERPYFFSMEGKYDAGPVLGHGGDCSLIATPSKSPRLDAWRRCSIVSSREPAASWVYVRGRWPSERGGSPLSVDLTSARDLRTMLSRVGVQALRSI